jgi:hypothetical protein
MSPGHHPWIHLVAIWAAVYVSSPTDAGAEEACPATATADESSAFQPVSRAPPGAPGAAPIDGAAAGGVEEPEAPATRIDLFHVLVCDAPGRDPSAERADAGARPMLGIRPGDGETARELDSADAQGAAEGETPRERAALDGSWDRRAPSRRRMGLGQGLFRLVDANTRLLAPVHDLLGERISHFSAGLRGDELRLSVGSRDVSLEVESPLPLPRTRSRPAAGFGLGYRW